MTPRILKLRNQSISAIPSISPERAILVTEFYRTGIAQKASIPVQRALAFRYILENKKLCINDGELIVGERGPAPKATPTYPEICLHSESDLDHFNRRDKIPFRVDEETKRIYRTFIIPFWEGKTIREKIFGALPAEWKAAYDAGVFTEFQEQRSPGHTALDDKIYRFGFSEFRNRIGSAIRNLDFINDPNALHKRETLTAMDIAAKALIDYADRHALLLDSLAGDEEDESRKRELETMAGICRKVPANPPQSFWEALQYYWFVHVGVITELNPWDAFNPGRLDQHLLPFYEKGIKDGSLTREKAKELLSSFWIKFNNHPAPPKTGVTGKESNTYVDFSLINIGGITPKNTSGVNDVSYLILDVVEEMRLLQPSAMIQVSRKNPDQFIRRALQIIRTGFGQPSIFNTDAIIQEMTRQGKSLMDARSAGASGCVEAGVFGKESYILTGYFNLPKILELTLFNGEDPMTGKTIGMKTGDPTLFETFDEFFRAFEKQLNFFTGIKIRGNNMIEQINARYMPVPFLSLLIDDCIDKGMDYNEGGARYNTSYIQGVGIATVTDALSAIRWHIFDHHLISMNAFKEMLCRNFKGDEDLRARLINGTPKYGNDDEYADSILQWVFEAFFRSVDAISNARGGVHRINLLPTTCHVYFGSKVGALPDGRYATLPLSEGISPVQGADRNGPTAVLKSASCIDHLRTGGTLLNQKFLPAIFRSEAGISQMVHLIRSYFKMDGHHIQFNVVDRETLIKAKANPGDYRDLIVRVAGYSDYFVDLTEALQDEIIRRTAHEQP